MIASEERPKIRRIDFLPINGHSGPAKKARSLGEILSPKCGVFHFNPGHPFTLPFEIKLGDESTTPHAENHQKKREERNEPTIVHQPD